VPHLRLRALPILLAALWQTDGEHFGVPKSVLLPAFVQRVSRNLARMAFWRGTQKLGYQKRGRQIYGPDYVPKIPVRSAKESPTPSPVEQTG
jgi:hypothetical protein